MTLRYALFAALALAIPLAGCGSSTPAELPKDQQVKFKGGPIPPGVLEKMKADAMKRAKAQMSSRQ